MSDDRQSPEPPDRDTRIAEPGSSHPRTRRSLWTIGRHLLWTSTVASACTATRVQTAPLPERLPSGQRGEIRLSLKSGQVVSMYDAKVERDSIVGFNQPRVTPNAQRVAVARADVQSVATEQVSFGKTVLAVIGGTFATLALILVVACNS